MRKFLFTILFTFMVSLSFAQMPQRMQHPHHFNMPNIDKMEYCVIDSLPLERITIYSPYDYSEADGVIKLGETTYLMEMPFSDKMIIATNKDRTKAIILIIVIALVVIKSSILKRMISVLSYGMKMMMYTAGILMIKSIRYVNILRISGRNLAY